ncbi:nucleotide sugar dehydrogenase [Verrucomicrobia bacterium]|nr:nucleotide sugar dehydrogenase [Verrucomicrobiota bacterium]MDC0324068.1 nucleotide sugar dehydrogenase [Verrucomicrobiota bacterium]
MNKTKIAIVGLGYVGLPLGLQFARSGVEVIGLDVDQSKVDSLNQGQSYIKHIESSDIQSVVQQGSFGASTDFSRIAEVESILICVPTPLDQHRDPDISYVIKSGEAIAPHLKSLSGGKAKLVVLESTTYPGTTDTELREVLEVGSELEAGNGFHLAYSPEREDPGRTDHSVKSIPKVMGGYTTECLNRCTELYLKALDKVHPVKSCRIAEATKLTENIFRSVNIALVNELKLVFHKMDIDVWDVVNAAATKPFGYMPFYPGPGLGGHCIPIDPFYLTWKAREFEQHTRFIELAGEINTAMPDHVISRVADALNDEAKSIKGSRILLLGLAYKPNVDDDRESSSYRLIEKLENKGAKVDYNDPHVPEIRLTRDYSKYAGRKSQEISENYDLILVATHHNEYKGYDFSQYQIPVVDTRNCITKKPSKYYQA